MLVSSKTLQKPTYAEDRCCLFFGWPRSFFLNVLARRPKAGKQELPEESRRVKWALCLVLPTNHPGGRHGWGREGQGARLIWGRGQEAAVDQETEGVRVEVGGGNGCTSAVAEPAKSTGLISPN